VRTRVVNFALAAASIIAALGATEFLLRALGPSPRAYFVLPPSTNWVGVPSPDVLPGVHGESHFRINRFGVRGRPFGDDSAEYRILAIGGSTTLCSALDDAETWTHLLEADLGQTVDGRRVWVGNVGRDGASTRDNVLHIKYLLRQYPRVDVVVSLVGVNDLGSALHQGWEYHLPTPITDSSAERERLPRAFAQLPGRLQDPPSAPQGVGPTPWYKATALWQLGRRARAVLRSSRSRTTDNVGGQKQLREARAVRQAAREWVDSLPPLEEPLIEYRRNLNAMADFAARAGARLVFVTQPSAWRRGMPDAQERLLWTGWIGQQPATASGYFTSAALARAMVRFNETLLEVCSQRRLECVDLARVLPKDTTAIYDDVHFTEQGSRLVAQALVEHFRARPPFRRPT